MSRPQSKLKIQEALREASKRIQKAKAKNLTTLDLSEIGIESLPESITELQNLTTLILHSNRLASFPVSIANLKNLTTLDLRANDLYELPENITQIPNLTTLYLGSNHYFNLSESIITLQKLEHLKELDLSEITLTTLPKSFIKLQNLTSLVVRYHRFTSLPEVITKLRNLEYLDLSRSDSLTSMPNSIAKLQNLTTLVLEDSNLPSLPEAITKLKNLKKLILRNNHLASLPESITLLTNLKWLILDRNQLCTVPESITKLKSLTSLGLGSNQLTGLPESIVRLRNLEELNLGENSFVSLSQTITQLQNLKYLDLSNNSLTSLPKSMVKLQKLQWLILGHNQFAGLPMPITKLTNLTSLDFANNQLTSLPASIVRLKNLEKLDVGNNQLTSLPKSITKLRKLTKLNLKSNQLATPPQEVAQKGIVAIREYFRQLGVQGQDRLYEAKLLILGESGAGKTTLAKKIEDLNYVLQDEKTTEGVGVMTWSFPIDGGKSFRVNIWDFGGQEIYHATHQFFLTKRSLYALVADTRNEDTDFYYWLNVVELLSDNSPLLIIKNEKQDRHRDLNERQLRGQFENLKEVLATNLKTNRGLDKVKDEIEHYIKNLPHIGSPLPKTWVRVREKLESDPRNYISLETYLAICKENGFIESKDSLQLSGYLHDIGVFLHFQDEPLLKKTVILKPKWGTDAVYKVLDNKAVIRNLGRFTRADVEMIWDAPEYQSMCDELLQLMMKFKLCYEIPVQKGTFIAPQLLTENQPDYKWDEEENLLLRYSYEFMPKGILLQFIVVMSENIWHHIVWKSGVVLEKDKTRAEVIEFYGKRQIHVRVEGRHKKELMTIVLHEMDKIHATYKRLKYDKLIPCNCTTCRATKEPYFHRFVVLQNFVEKRIFEIQCGVTGNMVNVRGLIDDIVGWKSEKEVKEIMSKQKRSASGGFRVGDNFSGMIITGTVKNSFNKIESADISDELEETLKQLVQAVEAMNKSLPKKQASEVSADLGKLVEEATKESPNEEWYSVSIDGLTKAAVNLGKLGEPVVKLAGKVLSLLAMG